MDVGQHLLHQPALGHRDSGRPIRRHWPEAITVLPSGLARVRCKQRVVGGLRSGFSGVGAFARTECLWVRCFMVCFGDAPCQGPSAAKLSFKHGLQHSPAAAAVQPLQC